MNAQSARFQLLDHRHQVCDFLGRQRRGRFVHDEDPRVDQQGLGDLDHLLLGDGQRAAARLRIDGQAELLEQLARLLLFLRSPG